MRKFLLTVSLVSISMLITGCEKSKGCEKYSPWPSAEAQSAWTNYSPELLDSLDAYNDVVTTLNYFGRKPSYVHDSIVAMHSGDSVLICGYLNLWKSLGDWDIYMVTESFHDNAIDTEQDEFITVYINNSHVSLDTLQKAYIPALFEGNRFPEDYNPGYCCAYTYTLFLNTEDCPIRYE